MEQHRRHKLRLSLVVVLIVVSAGYALLVSLNPRVASALALGYIAVFLTIFGMATVWRNP